MSSMKDLFSELEPDIELLRDGELVLVVWCGNLMASADFGGSDGAVECLGDFWYSLGIAAESGTPVA